ncbi:PucR family transcriptional regulator [Amycolatopsis thermoflava]|uniref:PucR family transcriptional regulator n=1 Tax=Amycolatopsis thermoflava TaxID=84480 RepID=UPI003F4A7FDD
MRSGPSGNGTADGDVARWVVTVATDLNPRLGDITDSIRVQLAERIDALRGDQRLVDLLRASIESNVDTILHILQHDIPVANVEPPSAAVEYARRLAQRGVPVYALVRAYRLGQDHLLKLCFAEIERRIADAGIAFRVSQRFVEVTFSYIDWISQQVTTVYEDERERWLENRSTLRAVRIRELLDGRDFDLESAEAAIGHPLRQHHLGVVVWRRGESESGDNDLSGLERTVSAVGRALRCTGRPLFAACDRTSGWAWLPFDGPVPAVDPATVTGILRGTAPGVAAALGKPAADVNGFRETHRQALLAQRVALVAGPAAHTVTSYGDPGVRAAALMCADLDQARTLVHATLGKLALDDPYHARLRETLLSFMTAGSSYTAAAERLTLHKNSVKYRVLKAEEERGAPIGDDRLDVELALTACHWLGPSLLIPAGSPARGG